MTRTPATAAPATAPGTSRAARLRHRRPRRRCPSGGPASSRRASDGAAEVVESSDCRKQYAVTQHSRRAGRGFAGVGKDALCPVVTASRDLRRGVCDAPVPDVALARILTVADRAPTRAKGFGDIEVQAIFDSPDAVVVTSDPASGGRNVPGRRIEMQTTGFRTTCVAGNMWLAARAEGPGSAGSVCSARGSVPGPSRCPAGRRSDEVARRDSGGHPPC